MTVGPPKEHIVKKDMDECEMTLTFEEIKEKKAIKKTALKNLIHTESRYRRYRGTRPKASSRPKLRKLCPKNLILAYFFSKNTLLKVKLA